MIKGFYGLVFGIVNGNNRTEKADCVSSLLYLANSVEHILK